MNVRYSSCALVVRDSSDSPVELSQQLNDPVAVAKSLGPFMSQLDREHFLCLAMNTRNQLTAWTTVSVGTLSASLVHPREVFKWALLENAGSIICVHNHPSGSPEPSLDDKEITRRLSRCGTLLGVPLTDHIILAGASAYSFRSSLPDMF